MLFSPICHFDFRKIENRSFYQKELPHSLSQNGDRIWVPLRSAGGVYAHPSTLVWLSLLTTTPLCAVSLKERLPYCHPPSLLFFTRSCCAWSCWALGFWLAPLWVDACHNENRWPAQMPSLWLIWVTSPTAPGSPRRCPHFRVTSPTAVSWIFGSLHRRPFLGMARANARCTWNT